MKKNTAAYEIREYLIGLEVGDKFTITEVMRSLSATKSFSVTNVANQICALGFIRRERRFAKKSNSESTFTKLKPFTMDDLGAKKTDKINIDYTHINKFIFGGCGERIADNLHKTRVFV